MLLVVVMDTSHIFIDGSLLNRSAQYLLRQRIYGAIFYTECDFGQ